MPTPQLSQERALEAALAYRACNDNETEAARTLGLPRQTFQSRLRRAAERGLLGPAETLPGFAIKTIARKEGDAWVKQAKAPGGSYVMPVGQALKAQSVLTDAENRVMLTWHKTDRDAEAHLAAMKAAAESFAESLPRAEPVPAPAYTVSDLLNQYTLTDVHLGSLAWHEETGGGDYDLRIGERLIDDWFAAAIDLAPPAGTAILAQMGDLLHYDGFESVTPTHRHILDGDSRFDKMVRVAIRVIRKIIARLLAKHAKVHIIMADANHDPASEAWLRGMLSAFYENEPRVTVDESAGTYYVYRHGDVSLFYHHGHKRGVGNVDSVFAGRYREIYGTTKFSYAHLGHRHADELKTTNLMKVEQHETLAAPDAYAANAGWLSGRSAKVITYHARHGEVGRLTLTPNMVAGAAQMVAANDNSKMEAAA